VVGDYEVMYPLRDLHHGKLAPFIAAALTTSQRIPRFSVSDFRTTLREIQDPSQANPVPDLESDVDMSLFVSRRLTAPSDFVEDDDTNNEKPAAGDDDAESLFVSQVLPGPVLRPPASFS
jgi:hypothetical protein